MPNKFYALAGLRIKIETDEIIENNTAFLPFITEDGEADIVILLKRDSLPVMKAAPIFSDCHRAFYKESESTFYFSYYFENPEKGYVPYACFEKKADCNILHIAFNGKLWDKMIFDAIDFPDLLAENGRLLVHASLIDINGRGIIFTGNKGAGKSTQAALWEKHRNAVIINGDRALLYKKDGAFFVGGGPMCGSSNIALKRDIPLEIICLVTQGKENKLSKMPPQRAFAELLEKITFSRESEKITEKAVDILLDALEKVPFFELTCTADERAVSALERIILI